MPMALAERETTHFGEEAGGWWIVLSENNT
jgi:hypothetical protein